VTDEQWQEIWRIYRRASESPAAERAAFLESIKLDDASLDKLSELLGELDAPEQDAQEWPRLGQMLGRFELRAPLGCGGMGEVYLAFDPELHREAAIKCIVPRNAGAVDFLREARAASALNHPGIVTIYEVIRNEDTVAIVMELVRGTPFRELARKKQALSDVANWGRQIAEALAASHASGIVHRDIKPENLILRSDGYTKILDFGLAAESIARPMGTIRYMAPEQARAGEVTGAADVFSLGIVLFELAAGEHPFGSGKPDTTLTALESMEARSVRRLTELPAAFDDLLQEMTANDPGQRPSAAEMVARLGEIGNPKPTRRRSVLWIAALLVLTALVVWRFGERREDPIHLEARPFTTYEGSETQPAFSPDGMKIAFVWTGEHGDNRDIYIQGLTETSPHRLTQDPAEDLLPAFSPDGTKIAFLRQRSGSSEPYVMTVRTDGTDERVIGRIATTFGFYGLTWSPGGDSLIVRDAAPGGASLFRMNLKDGGKQRLTFAPDSFSDGQPAFSVDGKRLGFLRYSASSRQLRVQENGEERTIADSSITDFAWMPDGKHLLYAASTGLWRVNTTGDAEKIAEGNFTGLAADRSGTRLAFLRSFADANIWRSDGTRFVASSGEDSAPDLSRDGKRVVIRSNRSGNFELYTYLADGSGETQITHFGAHIDNPRWSPDGAWIAFDGNRAPVDATVKHHNIYLIPSGGGEVRRITDDAVHYENPGWSHDGHWIYYQREAKREELWKMPFESGSPVLVDPVPVYDYVESADGEYLYYVRYDGTGGIHRRGLHTGVEEAFAGTEGVQLFRYWALTNAGIYFVIGPPDATLRFLDLKTRKIARVADLPTKLLKGPRGMTASADGSLILYTLEDVQASDIMLARIK
jgi:Tol biopolymer transport system component